MRAIINKELRELIRLLPVGFVLIGFAVWFSLPRGLGDATNAGMIAACSALFAVLLAAMQGFFDLSDRQRGFLFHRSLSRSQILYGKVLAGLCIYLVAVALPLGCLAIYFAAMGPKYMTVHPLDVLPILVVCVAAFVMHPVSLLSIDREASWFGTRLIALPLAIVGIFSVYIITHPETQASVLAISIITSLFVALAALLLLALQRQHVARKLVLAGGALTVAIAGITFGTTFLDSFAYQSSALPIGFGVDKRGELWVYLQRHDYSANGYQWISMPVTGDKLRTDRQADLNAALPDDFDLLVDSGLARLDTGPVSRYQYGGGYGQKLFIDSSYGNVLIYDRSADPPLQGSVSRSGFHPGAAWKGEPFDGPAALSGMRVSTALISAGYESLWVDRDGVYQFDRERGTIETIVELPIESATILISEEMVASDGSESTPVARLYVESESKAHLFTLADTAGETDWFHPSQEIRMRPLPALQAIDERTFPKLPADISGSYPMLVQVPDGELIAFARYGNYERAALADAPDARWEQERLVPLDLPVVGRFASACMVALTPPGGLLIIGISSSIYATLNDLPMPTTLGIPVEYLPGIMAINVLVTLGSMTWVWLLARRRGLSRSASLAWSLGALLLGLAGPLIVIALYRREHREPCPRCERLRLIDRTICPSCGATWEPIQAEGIEIIDSGVRASAPVNRATAEVSAM